MSDQHDDGEGGDEVEGEHNHPSEGGPFQGMIPMVMTPHGIMPLDRYQRTQIAEQEYMHAMYRLFDELTEDQLTALQRIMHAVTHQGTGLAEHMEGIAVGILYTKYNVCMNCGINHMKELEAEVNDEQQRGDAPDE